MTFPIADRSINEEYGSIIASRITQCTNLLITVGKKDRSVDEIDLIGTQAQYETVAAVPQKGIKTISDSICRVRRFTISVDALSEGIPNNVPMMEKSRY